VTEASYEPPRFIAIEGPLRVGKTTLADRVAERLGALRLRDVEDNPFLAEFYAGKRGAAFQAQLYFLMHRARQHEDLDLTASASQMIVSDYLFAKDRIFAYLNLNDEELPVYEDVYNLAAERVPTPDLVIYLQGDPGVLRDRIARKRERFEQRITDEYLLEVVAAYEHFFSRYRETDLLVIETTGIDFVEREADLEQLLKRLAQPVRGTQYFLPLGSNDRD
jgi:deoxyguanosine kinase